MNELRKQSMKKGTQKKNGFYEAGRNKHKCKPATLAQNQVQDYDDYARNSKVMEFGKIIAFLIIFFAIITGLMYIL